MTRWGFASGAISVLAHVCVAGGLVMVHPRRTATPGTPAPVPAHRRPIEVTFVDPASAKAPRSAVRPAPVRTRPERDEREHKIAIETGTARPRPRNPSAASVPGPHEPPPADTGGNGPSWLDTRPAVDPAAVDLSPGAVARTSLGASAGSDDRRPAPAGDRGGAPFAGSGFRAAGGGAYETERETFSGRIAADGDLSFHDKGSAGMDTLVSGHFDTTDMVMRAIGDDPYSYEKMKIADATRNARLGMARVARSRRLQASVRATRGLLVKVWTNPRLPAAERRRILFRLWDECAEDGPGEVVRAAGLVRATIIGFIRTHLPQSSADAYTAGELKHLNRIRASHQAFSPYAPE